MSGTAFRRDPGCILFVERNACMHDAPQQIPIGVAVRAVQRELQEHEDRIVAVIESGRCYYVHNKIHRADCPTLTRSIWPTKSWYWITEDDDPDAIESFYAEVIDAQGSGGFCIGGRFATREEASQTVAKRCRTCAPDVIPRTATKRAKKVAGLGASDLGRLLDGYPIMAITHEPGIVTVRTSETSHTFAADATVLLDPALSARAGGEEATA